MIHFFVSVLWSTDRIMSVRHDFSAEMMSMSKNGVLIIQQKWEIDHFSKQLLRKEPTAFTLYSKKYFDFSYCVLTNISLRNNALLTANQQLCSSNR